jgi:hypothetical protein
VTLAGGRQVQPAWSPDPSRPGVYTAQIGIGITMDGLFVNGRRQVLARYPNFDSSQPILDGCASRRDRPCIPRIDRDEHPERPRSRVAHARR